MTVKFDPRDWNATLAQLQRSTAANEAETPEDVRRRDEFRVRVIEARVKLKLMRDRTEALRQSLERFRARRQSLSA